MPGEGNSLLMRGVKLLAAFLAAGAFTLAIFLVLPLMQTIGNPIPRDLTVRNVDVGELPPPPPPPPEEQIEEEEPPEPPPELIEEAPPLDLAQLELALNPGFGEGLFGDFAVNLNSQFGGSEGSEKLDEIFSLADLDQRPRVIFQRAPTFPQDLRKAGRRGTVYVTFMVDREGRVQSPKVKKSTDPAFDRYALEAVKQWKFEPGTRNGEKVQFKMGIPITFNAS
jgi:protein TonB